MGWNQYLTTFQNFKISVKGETPGGIWTLPRALSNISFFYFLLHLIKTSKHVRITYAQNHFKSTFGSTYLNSKKIKLKLAKQVKKEPRKARFPWDLGFLFVQPMKYALIFGFNHFKCKTKSRVCNLLIFCNLPCKTDDFLMLDLECLMILFRIEI